MVIQIAQKKTPVPISGMGEKLAYSAREAAALLSISERTLRSWSKAGRIKTVKAGSGKGRVLFPLKALEDFLNGVKPACDVR